MSLFTKKIKQVASFINLKTETDPRRAYDIWSLQYDTQPYNLMLAFDESVFSKLTKRIDFHKKVIADVGCGTGRHWDKFFIKHPARVIGYDVSEGMLTMLKKKFPAAEVHQLVTNRLTGLEDKSCDILFSTLAVAHIQDIESAFTEWSRVLKPGGHVVITDYHPDALSKGADRTFKHEGKLIAIKNYIHPINKIESIADRVGFMKERFIERKIDERVKPYYEKQQALKVFEKFKGTAIIYGVHFIRKDAIR